MVETKLQHIADKANLDVKCAREEPCAWIAQARFWEGPGPTDVWLKYCDTAGKPGGKLGKQTLTYSIGRNRSTRPLTLCLHEQPGALTSEVVSHEKLYTKLSGCMIDQIEVESAGLSTFNVSAPSNEQKELLSRIKLKSLLQRDIIKKIRSRIIPDWFYVYEKIT